MAPDRRSIELLSSGRIKEVTQWIPDSSKKLVTEVGGRVHIAVLGTLDQVG